MTTILGIDPGMRSGIVWGAYSANVPYVRLGFLQQEGGMVGLMDRIRGWHADVVVCEKFKTRPMARNYRLNELEPIRIEGWLYGWRGEGINWQYPEARKLTTGPMKESEEILKRHDLWLTGKDVGMNDADDAIAAQLHILAYLRNIGHEPTIRKYWS